MIAPVAASIAQPRASHKLIIETGLKKFGAMLADNVEVGCNSVLNPGTVAGRFANIYPLSMVRGYVPEHSIYKKKGDIVKLTGLASNSTIYFVPIKH